VSVDPGGRGPFDSIYRHGFVRVAVAVPSVRVVDPAFNVDRTLALARQASADHALLVLESIHPADARTELAERSADLIVAGTRAVGLLRPIRLGGVTMALLHHSDVAVIAVPPEA